MQRKLEALGFEVIVRHDVGAIVASVRELKPALIITDVRIPHTFKQCQQLRVDPALKNIPILIHALSPTRRVVEGAAQSGASTMILKPAAVATLLTRIHRFLTEPQAFQALSESVAAPETPEARLDRLLKQQGELKAFPSVVIKAMQVVQSGDSGAGDWRKSCRPIRRSPGRC